MARKENEPPNGPPNGPPNRRFLHVSENGQITLPAEFRRGIGVVDYLECTLHPDCLLLRPVPADVRLRQMGEPLPDPVTADAYMALGDRILEGKNGFDRLEDLVPRRWFAEWEVRFAPDAAERIRRLMAGADREWLTVGIQGLMEHPVDIDDFPNRAEGLRFREAWLSQNHFQFVLRFPREGGRIVAVVLADAKSRLLETLAGPPLRG